MTSLDEDDPLQIGRYRLLRRLGAGGMGTVYLGESPGGRLFAVKRVHRELAKDPLFIEKFRKEIAAAKKVGGVYTAAVVEANTEVMPPWLATAYVQGPSLADTVKQLGPLSELAVWRLAGGLIEALQAVHECDLVHRDLKPDNVLLALDGPQVIDFGISRVLADSGSSSGRFAGTPAYMSPEQVIGEAIGPASDVFSLGSVLAFAASGEAPFWYDQIYTQIYRVINYEPDLSALPEGIRKVVEDCLRKDAAKRPTLAKLLERVREAAPRSSTGQKSFWPRPLADYIRSHYDLSDSDLERSDGSALMPVVEAIPQAEVKANPTSPSVEAQRQESDSAVGEEPATSTAGAIAYMIARADTEPPIVSALPGMPGQLGSGLPTETRLSTTATSESIGSGATSQAEAPPFEPAEMSSTTVINRSNAGAGLTAQTPPPYGPDLGPPSNGQLTDPQARVVTESQSDGANSTGQDDQASDSSVADSLRGPDQGSGPGGPVLADREAQREDGRQARRKLFAAGAGILTTGMITVLAYAIWPDHAPASQPRTVSFNAPAAHYGDGLEIKADWTLGGANGTSLTEKISASYTKTGSLSVQYREPVPVAILKYVANARFTPALPMIIDHGQGLVWPLRLRPGVLTALSYQVHVPGHGVSKARLRELIRSFTAVPQGPVVIKPPPITLQSLTIIPKSLRLHVGHSERLSLVGLLSNGKTAPATYLAKVRWTTTDRHVASVNSFGKVTAAGQGEVKVIATVGAVSTLIYVHVTDHFVSPNTGGATPTNSAYTSPYSPPSGGTSTSTTSNPPPPSKNPTTITTITPPPI